MMADLIAFIFSWQYVTFVAAIILVGLVVTPGRIGRIACHWGLHDTHIFKQTDYSRWFCTRCPKTGVVDWR
jgi:hypothetical protein